jgi:hypothetical protein
MSSNNSFGGFGGGGSGGGGAPPTPAAGGGFGGFGTPQPEGTGAGSGAGPTTTQSTSRPMAGRAIRTSLQGTDLKHLETDGRIVRLVASDGNHENFTAGACAIDGICPFDFDPASNSEPGSPGVVIWDSRGGTSLKIERAPALTERPKALSNGTFEVLTDRGYYVSVPPSVGRIVTVEEIFSPKVIVLYGDDRKKVPADFPLAAPWRAFVKSCRPTIEGDAVVYHVELHGLNGSIVRRYSGAEVVDAGELPSEPPSEESQLRIMVWPRNPPPQWSLFVVDVGTNNNDKAWTNKYAWSLFHHPPGKNEDQRVVPCRNMKDGSEILRRGGGLFAPTLPLRVATSDRPHYIEVRRTGEDAVVSTFNLLKHAEAASTSASSTPEEWAVDIGTSNSCVTRLEAGAAGGEQVRLVNFNQISAPRTPEDLDSSLVLCRIGDQLNPRSELHWMPGLDSPNSKDLKNSAAITQLPSRLALLVRDRLPESLGEMEIAALIPMCDAIVPPLVSESFGIKAVDDSTVDRLKWVEKHDTRRVALLELYITNVLLMAAARVRPSGNVSVRFSQPLAFNPSQREGLQLAASRAAKRLTKYTGVDFEARIDSDESHCILEQFASLKPGAPPKWPVWLLCDIGGGSIDIAVATGLNTNSYAVVAADSIKFGANLVFDNVLELAGQQVGRSPDPRVQRRRARELVLAQGYEGVIAACNSSTKQHIQRIVQMYFELVAEYVARVVAGCFRNPKRLKGLWGTPGADAHRHDPPTTDQGGFDGVMSESESMAAHIELLVTGNGFRTFDVLGPSKKQMEQFTDRIRSRCAELICAPTGIASKAAADDAWFATVPPPDAMGSLGLAPKGGAVYLKEALAYSILKAGHQGSADDRTAEDLLAAPNGVTEYGAPWPARRIPGSERPWYAFVGVLQKEIKRSDAGASHFKVDRNEPWYITDPSIIRDEKVFGPSMPTEVMTLARDLRWNLDLNQLCQQNASELGKELRDVNNKRQWPLLKVIYERAIMRLFASSDFLS